MNERGPEHDKPVHGVFQRLNNLVIVFVTISTKNRKPWLATNVYHDLLQDVWRNADRWLVGRYVLMPDHIHFFSAPNDPEFSFENWMRYWRSQFTKRNPNREHLLQSDYWDRRLRKGESYNIKRDYVRENTVRKGLANRSEDWPFAGELFELRW